MVPRTNFNKSLKVNSIVLSYEPTVNYAAVTVEPTSTQIAAASNVTTTENGVKIAPPKTPQELQQEAEEADWLQVWHEFSWWFPWYRFRIVYFFGSQRQFDVGISSFPWANTLTAAWQFLQRIAKYLADIAFDVFIDYMLGEAVALVGAMREVSGQGLHC